MFTPLSRAIDQLDDPAIQRVLIASLVLAAACFALLCAGSAWWLHHALARVAWVAMLAGFAGGAVTLVAALWLFLPVAVVIASLFMEPVCRAVEQRFYPGLPRASGAHLATQLWDGAVVGCLVLALSLLCAVLSILIPGIGFVLGWAITAWALGRGLFVAVAMRRMKRAEANRLYLRHRGQVLAHGAILALAGYVPLVNFLVPVLGTACMVHVLMARVPTPETWG